MYDCIKRVHLFFFNVRLKFNTCRRVGIAVMDALYYYSYKIKFILTVKPPYKDISLNQDTLRAVFIGVQNRGIPLYTSSYRHCQMHDNNNIIIMVDSISM